jgi:hypothetical protein
MATEIRQLKSSFVRPFSTPGAPTPDASGNPYSNSSNNQHNAADTVGPSAPTSYAESLLFHKSFYFQQRRGTLDLRSISRVDIERIIREVDIDTLQSFLENITFSDLNSEELSLYSDECFLRLFQISQLTLEYLLNVQDTLASNLDSLAQKYSRKKRELERTKASVADKDQEIEKLKRENRRKRKTILAYETMLRQTPPAAEAAAAAKAGQASVTKGKPSDEIHVYIIRWFIGTCIDLTLFGSTTVLELKSKLQSITQSTMALHDQSISLKGMILKDGDRLCDIGVSDESVLVLMDGNKPPEPPAASASAAQPQVVVMQQPASAPSPMSAFGDSAGISEMKARQDELHKVAMESQSQLQSAAELLREEIRKGQEREVQMKEEMERRVKMLEETIRHEVKQELQLQEKSSAVAMHHQQQAQGSGAPAPVPVKMSNAGELESDDEEEEVLTRTEIAARMGEAEQKARRLEAELRASIEVQRQSIKDAEDMRKAMKEAKRREEEMRIEKENAILMAPKRSAEPVLKDDDDDDSEDEPLKFADDDSEDEKEAAKKDKEKNEEEEKEKAKAKEAEEKANKEKANKEASEKVEVKDEAPKQPEKTEEPKVDDSTEAVKLPEEWEILFKDDKVSVSLDASSDLESVRTSLASKLKDAASAEQVSFMRSVEVEVDGKLVTQSVEIKSIDELRSAHAEDKLQVGVKRKEEGEEGEENKPEVIDFGTVARKIGMANDVITKMAALRGKHLDDEEEDEEEKAKDEEALKPNAEEEEKKKEGEDKDKDKSSEAPVIKEGEKVKLPGMKGKGGEDSKEGADKEGDDKEGEKGGEEEEEEEEEEEKELTEEEKKKKAEEEAALKKVGKGGCCKQS